MLRRALTWIDRNILELGREMRFSYLPPLMVYMAAGISGLTNIVGTFFVKDYLGLSAEFLAALGFWAGLPWAIKIPLGHLVDLLWRFKAGLVWVGAGLIAASLGIMIGLLGHTEAMRQIMPVEAWYVLSVLLAPVGYVVQDVVADAMTVEAVLGWTWRFRVSYYGASFQKHRQYAEEKGLTVEVVDSFLIHTDIDKKEDLVELLIHGTGMSSRYLQELGFALSIEKGRVGVERKRD